MNSSLSPTLRSLPSASRWLVALGVALSFAGLYGLFGYLTAYGPHLSVAHSMIRLYGYEEWSHCAIVPFIIAGLIWWKRRELAEIPVRPSRWGLPAVLAGFGFFWMSYRLDDIYFAFISIQCLAFGAIVYLLGWHWMRALLFPWLFLVFAWPLFFLDNAIAFPLRMVMSTLSAQVLNMVGLPAIQIGTSLQSAPDLIANVPAGKRFQVDVADPCSGMRSLFALTMVTALYAYITMNTAWKQVVLVACAIPLAIIGNLARILMLTIGILVLGPQVAIGSLESPSVYHMFSGFFVFIVALGGMLTVATLLNGEWRHWLRWVRASSQRSAGPGPTDPQKPNAGPPADLY